MRIDVFTIFPTYLEEPLQASLLGKAADSGLIDIRIHNIRDWATGAHKQVDDAPFGGGAGMVMMPDPIFAAVEDVKPQRPLYLMSAGGQRLTQVTVEKLSTGEGFSLLCGRYEGVDQRVADELCDGEISLGDFVLSGGEVAALAIIESVARLVPGVMGNEHSAHEESFAEGLLEYPQYTQPAEFRGMHVPEVLLSGNHAKISRWRRAQSVARTMRQRPDLLTDSEVSGDDCNLLKEFGLNPSSCSASD